MKFFIAALVATLAAADTWAPKEDCLAYLDEQARWLGPRAEVAFVPKGADDWDQTTTEAYQAQIADLKAAPEAGALSDEIRAIARQLLDSLDWENKNGAAVVLSEQSGWPTYTGDFAADCVEAVTDTVDATLGLENSKKVVKDAVLVNADSGNGVQATAVTGWKKFGGGSDAAVGYQLAMDFASGISWNGQGSNAVTLIFGNDDTVTNLEYNEFNVINFAGALKIVRLNYKKQNLDTQTVLPDITGYAKFDDDKTYTVSWTEARGNWAQGALANVEYSANVNTAGFWQIDRSNTKLLQGQTAGDATQILLTVQKETLGAVTTGIKAGGKIHGLVCFKADIAATPCTELSDVVPFAWAAEPVVPDDGNTDNSGNGGDADNDENKDSAMSMAAYGASFLAAISALAF